MAGKRLRERDRRFERHRRPRRLLALPCLLSEHCQEPTFDVTFELYLLGESRPARELARLTLMHVIEAAAAWALLSMREEYLGGLDRYVRYIPGHLSATYRLRPRREGGRREFTSIGLRDAKRHADIESALQGHYADVVETVATSTGADEAVIRRWFATDLISPQSYRRQTLAGPESDGSTR